MPSRILSTGVAVAALGLTPALPLMSSAVYALENSVTIESQSFLPGQSGCRVGVFLENAIPICGIVLPFEFRSQLSGAYIADNLALEFPTSTRLYSSALGPNADADQCPLKDRLFKRYPTLSGQTCQVPVSTVYSQVAPNFDFVSPDAFLSITSCTPPLHDPDTAMLPPGADPIGNPSVVITFDAGSTPGVFEISAVCVTPANRLLFVDYDGGNFDDVDPGFTAGIITIECGPCRCHANPNCDDVVNILDVQFVVNRAIRGATLPCEPYAVGGNASLDGPTDVDCSGNTDILDVVRSVEVAFRAGDPAVQFCDPCP